MPNGGPGISLQNINSFVSTGRTGTGSQETIKHGLAVAPLFVILQPRDNSNSAIISAPWDNTNIYVTVANTAVYDLMAIL